MFGLDKLRVSIESRMNIRYQIFPCFNNLLLMNKEIAVINDIVENIDVAKKESKLDC